MTPGRLPGIESDSVSISVREQHLQQVLQRRQPLPFVEVMADNYLALRGPHYRLLQQVAQRHPVVLHCVGLSLGSGGADDDYLKRLARMASELGAIAVSDHLSVSQLPGGRVHDLLPIRYCPEMVPPLMAAIHRIQDTTGLPFIIENISRYLAYADDCLDEGELLGELHRRTGAGVLLDINNLYVTAHNLGLSPMALLRQFPLGAVAYCHLAGYQRRQNVLVDTHGSSVSEPVWQLYARVIAAMGPRPTIIEWDNDIPPLSVLLQEADRARSLLQRQEAI
ncbi:hypothetical protein SAMN04488540_12715 [Ferrimonas sediminum]|uniref:Uncharacterized protein n=1 Tax=Ferrimonas sediminum TaxID=718193 RepID=A0A1G9B566_9GAMM|nr:DUF692 domain-containing protein [Ferrimonas sediminum]SDK34200.1 hypothetical protein SAMN04488540_12715 [Ferrimonas sediminum]